MNVRALLFSVLFGIFVMIVSLALDVGDRGDVIGRSLPREVPMQAVADVTPETAVRSTSAPPSSPAPEGREFAIVALMLLLGMALVTLGGGRGTRIRLPASSGRSIGRAFARSGRLASMTRDERL